MKRSTPLLRIITIAACLATVAAACGDDTAEPAATMTTAVTLPADGGNDPDAAITVPVEAVDDGCPARDGSSAAQTQFSAEPPFCLEDSLYTATITTNLGVVHVALNPDMAPLTVNSFVFLARFHYFDNTTCHRAIQGFVVQCGDPTATGTGGPGYTFVDELANIAPYQIGSVAMANSGPDTNGSQFFLITGDQGAALPPNYTLFGQVIDVDLPVLAGLDAVANPADGPPLQPIDIISITIDQA